MPDYPALITTLLTADTVLMALLTGGIYNYEALPRNGLKAVATIWNNGKMKPCLIVKGRDEVPVSRIKDVPTQFQASRQLVELWLYNDGDAAYTTLKSAQGRIYTLLHLKRVAGSWQVRYTGGLSNPDPMLNNASTVRLEYTVIGHLGT